MEAIIIEDESGAREDGEATVDMNIYPFGLGTSSRGAAAIRVYQYRPAGEEHPNAPKLWMHGHPFDLEAAVRYRDAINKAIEIMEGATNPTATQPGTVTDRPQSI